MEELEIAKALEMQYFQRFRSARQDEYNEINDRMALIDEIFAEIAHVGAGIG